MRSTGSSLNAHPRKRKEGKLKRNDYVADADLTSSFKHLRCDEQTSVDMGSEDEVMDEATEDKVSATTSSRCLSPSVMSPVQIGTNNILIFCFHTHTHTHTHAIIQHTRDNTHILYIH